MTHVAVETLQHERKNWLARTQPRQLADGHSNNTAPIHRHITCVVKTTSLLLTPHMLSPQSNTKSLSRFQPTEQMPFPFRFAAKTCDYIRETAQVLQCPMRILTKQEIALSSSQKISVASCILLCTLASSPFQFLPMRSDANKETKKKKYERHAH